jgi:hypothetical protein
LSARPTSRLRVDFYNNNLRILPNKLGLHVIFIVCREKQKLTLTPKIVGRIVVKLLLKFRMPFFNKRFDAFGEIVGARAARKTFLLCMQMFAET